MTLLDLVRQHIVYITFLSLSIILSPHFRSLNALRTAVPDKDCLQTEKLRIFGYFN